MLALGETAIANRLVPPHDADQADPTFPLTVVFCSDCSLVQLGYELPVEAIFDDDYPYFSSFSAALCDHASRHVDGLVATNRVGKESFVAEIASNDGYLLRNFVDLGITPLGIDPSPGPAAAAESVGVPTIVGFFGSEMAARIVSDRGRADVIVANNVMAHVPDLNDFVSGLSILLGDHGVLTIENPYVRDLIRHCEFDTIYHEHYCYFSCTSVETLMHRHGLHLNDVEYFADLHGGTLRWWISRSDHQTDTCRTYLSDERDLGITSFDFYAQLAARVASVQGELRSFIDGCRADGFRVAGYGAAAKGATLLNSTGIGADDIDFVVDRNIHKHGMLMPGCHVPIRPVDALLEDQPDVTVILSWNFADEIVRQQPEYVQRGGRFAVPIPGPRYI